MGTSTHVRSIFDDIATRDVKGLWRTSEDSLIRLDSVERDVMSERSERFLGVPLAVRGSILKCQKVFYVPQVLFYPFIPSTSKRRYSLWLDFTSLIMSDVHRSGEVPFKVRLLEVRNLYI